MLEVYDLVKKYQKEVILKKISFKVKAGETLVIMGPSGSGKSTAIRCINRLVEPDSGKIIFAGSSLLELSYQELLKVRQRIGFVFQSYNLISHLNVVENIILPLLNQGCEREQAERKAEAVLAKVDLADKFSADVESLSGGEKQRVAIARVLAIEPELFLFDEPTAALDPILIQEVLEVIERLSQAEDKAIVIVTHQISFALKVADRILLLESGQIVESGKPSEIFNSPTSKVGLKYKKIFDYFKTKS